MPKPKLHHRRVECSPPVRACRTSDRSFTVGRRRPRRPRSPGGTMAAFEPTVYAERRATLDERMRATGRRRVVLSSVGRSRVPHRSATPLPDVRQHLLHPWVGVRCLLPSRPRSGLRAPPDGRRVRHAHRGARRVRRRQRDRRRSGDVRRPRRAASVRSARSPSSRARGRRRSSPSAGRATPRSSAVSR